MSQMLSKSCPYSSALRSKDGWWRVDPPEDVRLALRGGGKSAGAVHRASAAPPPVRPPVPAPISQTATPAPVAADVMTPAPVAIRPVSLPASSATGPARPPASPAPVAATFASGGPSFLQGPAGTDNGRAEWLADSSQPFAPPVMPPTGPSLNPGRDRPLPPLASTE